MDCERHRGQGVIRDEGKLICLGCYREAEQISDFLTELRQNWAEHSVNAPDATKLVSIDEATEQILAVVKEAGWDPATVVLPEEFGTPKAQQMLAQWAEANGYVKLAEN